MNADTVLFALIVITQIIVTVQIEDLKRRIERMEK